MFLLVKYRLRVTDKRSEMVPYIVCHARSYVRRFQKMRSFGIVAASTFRSFQTTNVYHTPYINVEQQIVIAIFVLSTYCAEDSTTPHPSTIFMVDCMHSAVIVIRLLLKYDIHLTRISWKSFSRYPYYNFPCFICSAVFERCLEHMRSSLHAV